MDAEESSLVGLKGLSGTSLPGSAPLLPRKVRCPAPSVGPGCRQSSDYRQLLLGTAALPGAAGAAPFAYVAVRDSNQVSVIDTAVNTVAATVPVPGGPYGVALTPDGGRAYVSSFFSFG
jgi:YVTN family beta-propeller protein